MQYDSRQSLTTRVGKPRDTGLPLHNRRNVIHGTVNIVLFARPLEPAASSALGSSALG